VHRFVHNVSDLIRRALFLARSYGRTEFGLFFHRPAAEALDQEQGSMIRRGQIAFVMNKIPAPDPQGWDLIIQPKTSWLHLHLADLWRYRDLTMLFVWRDFVAQYKQTILGPLWHLIQPLLTTIMFTIIFGKMAKLSTDHLPPLLFYMAGVTCWSYFADCVNRTSMTFISNAAIFGKVYFPRLSVPVSIVISSMIKFAIQFALFLAFLTFYWMQGARVHPNAAIALTPLLLVLMAGMGLGAGIIVSAWTTRYRDLQHLVAFGVQLMMFATPVVYPLSMIGGGSFRWLILANPMTPIIETFRYAYLGAGAFDPAYLCYSALFTAVMLFIGIVLFNRVEITFMDTV
jgi:lipopolysaccharide transport system permease protein